MHFIINTTGKNVILFDVIKLYGNIIAQSKVTVTSKYHILMFHKLASTEYSALL